MKVKTINNLVVEENEYLIKVFVDEAHMRSIDVYKADTERFGSVRKQAEVSWSSIGAVPADYATKFANAMLVACVIAHQLNDGSWK